MLEKLLDGQRSGVSPLFASLRSQNQLNVRRSSVSRKAVWRGVSADGGIGALIPVIAVALVHADAMMRELREARRNHRSISVTEILTEFEEEVSAKISPFETNRRWLRFPATSAVTIHSV